MIGIVATRKINEDLTELTVKDRDGMNHYFDVKSYDLYRYNQGEHIQNCFPYISAEDREIFITGITPEKWNEMFPEEDEK